MWKGRGGEVRGRGSRGKGFAGMEKGIDGGGEEREEKNKNMNFQNNPYDMDDT